MFGNGKKTIGVFINRCELEFQQEVIRGLTAQAQELGFNLAFMNSYGVRESLNMYDFYESVIINFAPMEDFEAIIVALDTYDTPMLRNKLLDALGQRAKCPVITFREENDKYYNVLANTSQSIPSLVEHFVEVHGITNIAFLAGYEGHVDGEARLQSYLAEMKKRKLPLPKNAVFRGDMWKFKGEEAYRFFFAEEESAPKAVICANDYMARALCEALQRHGKRVPEDVLVSGFDDVMEADCNEPRLTTIAVDFEEMARTAIRLVGRFCAGEHCEKNTYVPAVAKFRKSCGCEENHKEETRKVKYSKMLDDFMHHHSLQSYFSIDMDGCSDFEEMYRLIGGNLNLVGNYKDFYLCMFEQKNRQGYLSFSNEITKNVVLKLGYQNGRKLKETEIEFEQKELLPPEFTREETQIFHFTLLHNRNKCFGYTAVSYQNAEDIFDVFFHDWNLTISLAINELMIRGRLQHMIRLNEENSVTDYLTGLLNRRGLERKVRRKWEQWSQDEKRVAFYSIDLDGLKFINDTFGHKEGDLAITTVADAIKEALGEGDIAARTGGDEFVIVIVEPELSGQELFEQKFAWQLEKSSQKIELFDVSASIGSFCTVITDELAYDACVSQCDEEMYRQKKAKKCNRV